MVTSHLKTNRDLGLLQQAEPTKTFKKIRDAIMFDRSQTIDELEAVTGVSWSSCQQILTEELHMKQVAAKFVPRLLSECIECAAVSHKKRDDKGFATPYSPDLAPCNFFLFPRMKRDLKGKRFQNVQEVREKTTETLKAVTLQQFQNCFEQWKERWDKCIDCQGEYFEGDYILEVFREIYDLKKNLVIFAPRPVFPFHTCIRQWEAELCL